MLIFYPANLSNLDSICKCLAWFPREKKTKTRTAGACLSLCTDAKLGSSQKSRDAPFSLEHVVTGY